VHLLPGESSGRTKHCSEVSEEPGTFVMPGEDRDYKRRSEAYMVYLASVASSGVSSHALVASGQEGWQHSPHHSVLAGPVAGLANC
jgi:hypothetical protein